MAHLVAAITADPSLNVTSALRERGITDKTVVRRLQRLWQAAGAKRVARARRALEHAAHAASAPASPVPARNATPVMRNSSGRFVARTAAVALASVAPASIDPASIDPASIDPPSVDPFVTVADDHTPPVARMPFETLATNGFAQAIEQAFAQWKVLNDAAYGIMSHTLENAALYQRILAHWPTLR